MNLQPVAIEEIPIGTPLLWQLYDRNGYALFARGEAIASHQQLEALAADGLLRDVDALPLSEGAAQWIEFKDRPPGELFPPAGIKPQVGERIQLRLLGRDIQAYYYAHFIGYIKGQSILVTTPVTGGQRIAMTEGERLELRMLTGSNIYIFQSEILRVCVSPSHYLHLRYPERVQMQKLRNASRTRVRIAAKLTDAQGELEVAQIIDLSPDGAQVVVPKTVGEKGQQVRLSFQAAVDELSAALTVNGVIQHVRPAAPGQEWGTGMLEYGIAFADVSDENKLWLKCLVYRHIAEGGMV
ncbi:MAG: flagellar brake protein [Rhodocyclaceae bacterium]|nr:MAG: flagellar brake protein [Rhodocyclaceae bacterium]